MSAPTICIFRAVPANVDALRPGDFVADEAYALMHAEGMQDHTGEPWHVISATVPEAHLVGAGDDDEWHQDTGERREFRYVPEASS